MGLTNNLPPKLRMPNIKADSVATPNADEDKPENYIYRGKIVTNNNEDTTYVKVDTIEAILDGTDLVNSVAFMHEIANYYDPKERKKSVLMSDYLEVVARASDWLYPHLSREAGIEELGRALFLGRSRSVFGKIAFAGIQLFGPKLTILTAPRIFDLTGEVGKRSAIIVNEQANEYTFCSREVSGTYWEEIGALKAALEIAGAKNVQIDVEILAPDSWDYHIKFDWTDEKKKKD
jgi:uncharacterized protein (TIGR02265 family)